MSERMTAKPLPPPPPLDFGQTALFLDLDGTIAEIAPRPDGVGPNPMRTHALGLLDRALAGRLAVLTGRTLDEADRILERTVISVAAVHGLVRRMPDGAIVASPAAPALAEVKPALLALAAQYGLMVEDKGASVTMHYRQTPAAEHAVRELADRIAHATGLVVQNGSMVSELRTAGPDKGDSLRTFLADPRFAGAIPVMVGDDLTDEHAFAAAAEMGGYGVLVGPPRLTCAQYGLATVAEVFAWMNPAALQ
jgi:trehalose 6-phosphate phosphatase